MRLPRGPAAILGRMERTFHPQRRVAVIGASSGIGRASAELLRDRGDAVLAVGRDAAKLAALAPRAPSGAGTLVVAQADAGDRAAIAAAVRPQGPLDALVIAASGGIARPGPLVTDALRNIPRGEGPGHHLAGA